MSNIKKRKSVKLNNNSFNSNYPYGITHGSLLRRLPFSAPFRGQKQSHLLRRWILYFSRTYKKFFAYELPYLIHYEIRGYEKYWQCLPLMWMENWHRPCPLHASCIKRWKAMNIRSPFLGSQRKWQVTMPDQMFSNLQWTESQPQWYSRWFVIKHKRNSNLSAVITRRYNQRMHPICGQLVLFTHVSLGFNVLFA